MYAGASGAETLEATVLDPGDGLPVFHTLDALAGGGATPPTSSIFFANRFLRLERVGSRMMEHPAADGVFNGFVEFRTVVDAARIARPGAAPDQTIGTVTTTLEVGE